MGARVTWLNKLVSNPSIGELPEDWPRCACECGRPIPRAVVEAGKSRGTPAKYATKRCRKRAELLRYALRIAERTKKAEGGA
jgi:hypothetical protein